MTNVGSLVLDFRKYAKSFGVYMFIIGGWASQEGYSNIYIGYTGMCCSNESGYIHSINTPYDKRL